MARASGGQRRPPVGVFPSPSRTASPGGDWHMRQQNLIANSNARAAYPPPRQEPNRGLARRLVRYNRTAMLTRRDLGFSTAALLAACGSAPQADPEPESVQPTGPLYFELHMDTPARILREGLNLAEDQPYTHVDIPKMKQGGLTAGFFCRLEFGAQFRRRCRRLRTACASPMSSSRRSRATQTTCS